MSEEELPFITYEKLLEELESSNTENNLLLGNGFNLSLGVQTNYENIFNKMKEEHSIYKDLGDTEHDIETIIGNLKNETADNFLKKFINDKIKLDFMKAASSIVKDNIKNIYQEKNEGIHLLFRNFKNYFTLNYDPFLYLLLMKFKKKEQPILCFGNTVKYKQGDLTQEEKGIYKLIKKDYDRGTIKFKDGIVMNIGKLKKSKFESIAEVHLEGKNQKTTNEILKKLSNLLWEEINGKAGELYVNDSFIPDLFNTKKEKILIYKQESTQNLFFLHGAFHFFSKGKEVFKITSKQDKALYERLEEVINNKDEEIVCVFTDTNKLDEINKSAYLKESYEKLQNLTGSIVILGSALSENDKHIFDAINQSNIENVYISTSKDGKRNDFEKANSFFGNKNIILFNRDSISYN